MKGVKKKKAKVIKLSPAEKIQRDHRTNVRGVFTGAGFARMAGIADKQFNFQNQQTDVDDVFVFENIVVITEYTCAQTDGVGYHLKNKKIIFDKILNDPSGFINLSLVNFQKRQIVFRSITARR